MKEDDKEDHIRTKYRRCFQTDYAYLVHEKIVVGIVSAGMMAEHKMQATVFFC